jgi:hypothetical protein
MNRLHIVRAAAPAVFSRGLRHVSFCFEGGRIGRKRLEAAFS